jgi:hypothetical protein
MRGSERDDSLAADARRVVPAIAPFASPAKRHIFGVVARLDWAIQVFQRQL